MPNDDELFKGYERDISAELREMFYQRWQEIKERTTQTNIKALRAEIHRVDKKATSLGKVIRDIFRKGAGDVEKHVLD